MPKLNKKEKNLTIGFSIVISIFLIERFIFAPFIEKLESTTVRIKAEEEKTKRLMYMESQKESIEKTYEKLKPYIVLENSDGDTFSDIMNKIEDIAKQANIILLKMKPEIYDDRAEKNYNIRKVTLSVEGYLSEIVQFLYKIENSNYPLRIDKIDLKIKSRETSLMNADLDIHMMYF